MTSLVEALAKQAQATFSRSITDETFADSLQKLIRSVAKIRAADLKVGQETLPSSSGGKKVAPVTYIEVTENQTFSMGIFFIRSGARIPLHDHPGMFGVLKVILGSVKITSYSRISPTPPDIKIPQDIRSRVKSFQKQTLIPVHKISSITVSEKDEPCALKPDEGNYHEISSVGGYAAFLDILAPPYDMKTRDCNYYTHLESKTEAEFKTWLQRTKAPTDFWCDSVPYSGPDVDM